MSAGSTTQRFEELELALLEAVTKSAAQALERFGLEHQLQRAQETEAVARLGDGIVHQFCRALATIIGQCDLGTHRVHSGVSEVEPESSEPANELVQQLLAFSRQPGPQPVALDVDRVESPAPAEMPLPLIHNWDLWPTSSGSSAIRSACGSCSRSGATR